MKFKLNNYTEFNTFGSGKKDSKILNDTLHNVQISCIGNYIFIFRKC